MRHIFYSATFLLIRLIGLTILFPFWGWTQVGTLHTAQQISTRLFDSRDGMADNKIAQFLEPHKSPFRWAKNQPGDDLDPWFRRNIKRSLDTRYHDLSKHENSIEPSTQNIPAVPRFYG